MFQPYSYVKEGPKDRKGSESEIIIRLPKPTVPKIDVRRWASAMLIVVGILLLINQIVWPLLTAPPPQKPLLKPLAQTPTTNQPQVLGSFVFSELKQTEKAPTEKAPPIFYLTIPKLGIERAEVETNSLDLSPDERLGHYYGSGLPGRVGNSFIYGHSSLPIIYDPQDYRTIFTKLDELEEDDEFIIEFGGNIFKYRVEKKVVLEPEDVKPLDPVSPQFLQQSYVTLMTCVPPGLKSKRLLVQARLIL